MIDPSPEVTVKWYSHDVVYYYIGSVYMCCGWGREENGVGGLKALGTCM